MTSEERLENVEYELTRVKRGVKRRNRQHLIAMLVVAGVAFLLALYPRTWVQDPKDLFCARELILKVVRAQEFILEDEDGEVCATLGAGADGSALLLKDENGKPRVTLCASKDGPILRLYDENGNARATLGAFKDGSVLGLFDENEKASATLSLNKDGPILRLSGPNGKVSWQAP